MRVWFWAWLIATAGIVIASALARDRYSAPYAAGTATAAALEALRVDVGWQWVALIAVSSVVTVVVNRRRYRARHARGHVPPGADTGGAPSGDRATTDPRPPEA